GRNPHGCRPRARHHPGRVDSDLVGAAFEGALGLALGVSLREDLTLVVVPLALRQADLHLRPAVLEVDAEWDDGQALLLGLVPDLGDLLLVQEQLPAPYRIQLAAAERVRGDVHPVEPGL